jgi:hypothetical protein
MVRNGANLSPDSGVMSQMVEAGLRTLKAWMHDLFVGVQDVVLLGGGSG